MVVVLPLLLVVIVPLLLVVLLLLMVVIVLVAAGGSSFAGRGPSAFAGRDRSVAAGGSSAFAGRGPSVAAEPSVPASVSPKHSFADVTGRGVPAPVNKFKAVGNLPWVPRNDINRLIEACGCNNRVWDNEPIVNFPESEL